MAVLGPTVLTTAVTLQAPSGSGHRRAGSTPPTPVPVAPPAIGAAALHGDPGPPLSGQTMNET